MNRYLLLQAAGTCSAQFPKSMQPVTSGLCITGSVDDPGCLLQMLLDAGGVHVPTEGSLAVVLSVLGAGVGASLLLPEGKGSQDGHS